MEEDTLVLLDLRNIKYCKYPDCPQKMFGPHNHALKQCEAHSFCNMNKGSEIIDPENKIAIPLLGNPNQFESYCENVAVHKES